MATWVGTLGNDLAEIVTTEPSDVFGDSSEIMVGGQGGDDNLQVTAEGTGYSVRIIGDALQIIDSGRGGDDFLSFSGEVSFSILGDAELIGNGSSGGDDIIHGIAGQFILIYGDAGQINEGCRGGNDQIEGSGQLVGDAFLLRGVGGDDVLIAGSAGAWLFGDATRVVSGGECGDDRLISGTGSDRMVGDAEFRFNAIFGRDVFVFAPGNGEDSILDFRRGEDLIELRGFLVEQETVINTFRGSARAWDELPDHVQAQFLVPGPPVLQPIAFSDLEIEEINNNSIIRIDDGGSITVQSVTGLTESDFVLI